MSMMMKIRYPSLSNPMRLSELIAAIACHSAAESPDIYVADAAALNFDYYDVMSGPLMNSHSVAVTPRCCQQPQQLPYIVAHSKPLLQLVRYYWCLCLMPYSIDLSTRCLVDHCSSVAYNSLTALCFAFDKVISFNFQILIR